MLRSNANPQNYKQQQLKSNFSLGQAHSSEVDSSQVCYTSPHAEDTINDEIKHNIGEQLKDKMPHASNSKIMKSLSLSSTFQGPDFYSKNLKSKIISSNFESK